MKTIYTLFTALFFITTANSQTYNFKIENNAVTWQKVFENTDLKSLSKHLKKTPFTQTLQQTDNIFFGRSQKINNAIFKSSPYFASFNFDASINIEFKENRYKVIVSDLIFRGPELSAGPVTQKQNYDLTENVIKNNKIKTNKKTTKVLIKLNEVLTKYFTITKNTDNW